MIENAIGRLSQIIKKVPNILQGIDEEKMSFKPALDKWSKKEIMGHLIDSAANNHQRFVRGQFENIPEIAYDQNKWNEYGFYQQIETDQIISFWTSYNTQLIALIKRISTENLKRKIKVGDKLLTLEFLINDYVEHLEHHLKQIIEY